MPHTNPPCNSLLRLLHTTILLSTRHSITPHPHTTLLFLPPHHFLTLATPPIYYAPHHSITPPPLYYSYTPILPVHTLSYPPHPLSNSDGNRGIPKLSFGYEIWWLRPSVHLHPGHQRLQHLPRPRPHHPPALWTRSFAAVPLRPRLRRRHMPKSRVRGQGCRPSDLEKFDPFIASLRPLPRQLLPGGSLPARILRRQSCDRILCESFLQSRSKWVELIMCGTRLYEVSP